MKIKSSFVLFIVVMVCFFPSVNQAQEVVYRLHSGISLNKFTLQADEYLYTLTNSSNVTAGFQVGVDIVIPVYQHFGIRTGLAASQKGGQLIDEFRWGGNQIVMEEKVNLLYIDIPFFIQYERVPQVDYSPYLFGGMFAGFYTRGSHSTIVQITENGSTSEEEYPFWYFSNNLEKMNYGIIFGAGFRFVNLFGELKYDLGLADVTGPATHEVSDWTILSNRFSGFTLSAGWHF